MARNCAGVACNGVAHEVRNKKVLTFTVFSTYYVKRVPFACMIITFFQCFDIVIFIEWPYLEYPDPPAKPPLSDNAE